MAVSGVKARLMLFETAENNNMVSERKESKGEPPALAKFRQKQQQLQENKDEEDQDHRPQVAQKPGQLNLRQTTKADAESTGSASASNGVGVGVVGGRGVGKINVAKMFEQGSAPPPLRPVVPLKKPGASDTAVNLNSPETERPKVALKPPSKALTPSSPLSPKSITSTEKPPPSAPKPSSVTANCSTVPANQSSNIAPVKLPGMDNKLSLRKTSSSASSVSTTSSGSGKTSTSSHTDSNTNGPVDFRSILKPRPSLDGKVETLSVSRKDSFHSEPPEKQDSTCQKPDTSKRPSAESNVPTDEIVERQSDNKRFKKVKLSSLPPDTSEAPEKPDLPVGGIDLRLICQQHAKMLHAMANSDLPPPPELEDLIEEDIYDEGITPQVEIRQAPNRQSSVRESNRASLIPTMTAEEEGFDEEEDFYGDGTSEDPTVDLLYVDAASSDTKPASIASPSSPNDVGEEEEDIYMDEADIEEESEEAKKKRLKEEAEAKKKEQKQLKELEKKKKQEEKDEQKRRKKFNLTGDETNVGEGVIKEDAKGRGTNLAVKRGDKITIVRLDNNPPNKFLVKTATDMGYVESNNIEIDADVIRKVMLRSILSNSTPEGLEKSLATLMSRDRTSMMDQGRKDSTSIAGSTADDDQEIYDDVAVESPTGSKVNEEQFEEEEIYQDVA